MDYTYYCPVTGCGYKVTMDAKQIAKARSEHIQSHLLKVIT